MQNLRDGPILAFIIAKANGHLGSLLRSWVGEKDTVPVVRVFLREAESACLASGFNESLVKPCLRPSHPVVLAASVSSHVPMIGIVVPHIQV